LPEAGELVSELTNFRVKVRLDTGHEEFGEWRTGKNDDLVLAVAMAAWLGERVRAEEAATDAERIQQVTYYTRR
jgi:hypothetical protein